MLALVFPPDWQAAKGNLVIRLSSARARALTVSAVTGGLLLLIAPAPAQAWNCDDILGPETCDAIYGADDAAVQLVNDVYYEVATFGNQTIQDAYEAADEQRDRVIQVADETYATIRCYASGECQP